MIPIFPVRKSRFQVAVAGLSTVDIMVHPVELDQGIGRDRLVNVEPIVLATGGIVSNAGLAFAKLGMSTAAVTIVGDDDWGRILTERYRAAGVDTSQMNGISRHATSSTVVMVDQQGHRGFYHCPGVLQTLSKEYFLERLSFFKDCRVLLFGYYSLLPNIEPDLPEVFAAIRRTGCAVALDAAGSGGSMRPLDKILPHVDVYFPSYNEALHQTGSTDPVDQLRCFRQHGARGIVGVKLGANGVVFSLKDTDVHEVRAIEPPEAIVDTTGAGDSFFAGFLTGLLQGRSPHDAARLGTAVAAYSITGLGATAAIPTLQTCLHLARLA